MASAACRDVHEPFGPASALRAVSGDNRNARLARCTGRRKPTPVAMIAGLAPITKDIIATFRERHPFKLGPTARLKPDPRLARLLGEATGERLNA